MEWKFSEEHLAYVDALRDWLADVAPLSEVRQWTAAGDTTAFEEQFARDWSGVGLAEDIGGQGGGLIELALTAEELARAAVPSSTWLATVLAVPLLGDRFDLVESSLGGATVALLAPAECIPTQAPSLRVDSAGRISGTVPRVLAAGTATRFAVIAGEPGFREVRLVEAGAEGVEITPRRLLDRTRAVADVRLENVPSMPVDVDTEVALGAVSVRAAILVAADSLGATDRMLELCVDYSKQRTQFGVQIGSFQAVKHAAATMMVAVEAARSVIYYAAAAVEAAHPEAELYAAAAKAQVTGEAVKSADTALTVHGAIGYTWEHDLQLYYKRTKLNEQLFGAPRAWNSQLAQALELVPARERHLV